jgi:hypothetical protein
LYFDPPQHGQRPPQRLVGHRPGSSAAADQRRPPHHGRHRSFRELPA